MQSDGDGEQGTTPGEFPVVAVPRLGELLDGCGRIMKHELSALTARYWTALHEKGTPQGEEL